MSISNISISSDDSDHGNHAEFNFMKADNEEECVDLTQEYVDHCEPSKSPTFDTHEDVLPEVVLSGSQVASLGSSQGVSASSASSGATSSSGYGGLGTSGSRQISIDSLEDKSKRKKVAAEAKLAKKQKLAEDKLARVAALEMNKVYKPGECMKYMQLEIHPTLLEQWYCADIEREMRAAGARVVPAPELWHPALLAWSRRAPRPLAAQGGQVVEPCAKFVRISTTILLDNPAVQQQCLHCCVSAWRVRQPLKLQAQEMALSPALQRCPRALYVCGCDEAARLVRARRLAARLAEAGELAGCALTLVVHGVKDYFNLGLQEALMNVGEFTAGSEKTSNEKIPARISTRSTNRRTANSSHDVITEIELEMALTDLIVTAGCDTAIVNTPNELALLIVQFTKAIAEEPHKKIKRGFDEQAEFYMRGDNKKCVPMDKDGNGASRLWQQMIAVLPGSSLETSRSVCGQYKSPLALYTELQSPNGANKLAEIGVSRTGVPGSKSRRLGPEFARKLRTLFTAKDGDVLLD